MKPAKNKPIRRASTPPTTEPKTAPDMPPPAPETVLLSVTGMSPAILTETIWALANPSDNTAPIIPDRILVVTTVSGRNKINDLFTPSDQLGGQSPWDALRAALAKKHSNLTAKLRFGNTADDIRVITWLDPASGCSAELTDIRSRTDNEAAADFILDQVRSIVENPDTQLIASIAGGRKTMSSLLYACMTLLGRETDRLTHVLVNEPFDTLRDFWFPDQPGGPLRSAAASHLHSGKICNPADATLDLAEVPFVPLRNLFARELGRKPGTFTRLVEECSRNITRRAAENLRLTVETTRTEIEVNGQRIRLAAFEHLLFLFLARRAKHGEPPYPSYKEAVTDFNAFRAEQLQQAQDINDWRHADSLRAPWGSTDEPGREITKAVSGIRDKLRQAGRDAAVLASCLPRKGECALQIPGPMIYIK